MKLLRIGHVLLSILCLIVGKYVWAQLLEAPSLLSSQVSESSVNVTTVAQFLTMSPSTLAYSKYSVAMVRFLFSWKHELFCRHV